MKKIAFAAFVLLSVASADFDASIKECSFESRGSGMSPTGGRWCVKACRVVQKQKCKQERCHGKEGNLLDDCIISCEKENPDDVFNACFSKCIRGR